LKPLAVASIVAAGLIVAGCGSDDSGGSDQPVHGVGRPARSTTLVNAARPPYVNALAVDPGSGAILLATNRGLFTAPAGGGPARRIRARARAGRASGPYGLKVSAFAFTAPGRLVGSGHPDGGGGLPGFLGVLVSGDEGRTWRAIARVELSDLHVVEPAGRLVYAFDTVLGGTIVSADGGRTWRERRAPEGPALALAADPAGGGFLLGATATSIARSTDGGTSWEKIADVDGAQLEWTRRGLFRAVADGTVSTSDDRGVSWTRVGRLAGTPAKLTAGPGGSLYAAMLDGTVFVSRDDGRSWRELVSP
jgi:photosystem II stability/assembly factor-like uncharacterized protein